MPVREELHCCDSVQGAGGGRKEKSRGRTCREPGEFIAPEHLPRDGAEMGLWALRMSLKSFAESSNDYT